MMESCDILITHSGVGSIISGLKYRKRVIVFPRLMKYGEHVDDHQTEIADTFSKMNYVLACNERDDLGSVLEECRVHQFDEYISQRKKMLHIVKDYLDHIE